MKIPVVIERVPEEGPAQYVAYRVPPMAIGHGETREAAIEDLRASILSYGEMGFTPPSQAEVTTLEV